MNRAWIPVFTAVAVVTLAFVSRTLKAEAASVGECFSSQAALINTMIIEHMHTYASATTVDEKGHFGAFEMFADENGNAGYVMSSDEPFGSDLLYTSHPICIEHVVKNVGLYDARLPGVPEQAKLQEDPAAIKRQCQPYGADCISHNTALQNIADNQDAHVMVQATIVQSRFNDANRSPGDIITVVGRVSGVPLVINQQNFIHPGELIYSTPEGASLIPLTTFETSYGNFAINRLSH